MRQLNFIEAGRAEWREAREPTLEGPGQAILEPLAVAACDLDGWVMRGSVPFQGPFPLGHEFVGEVVEAGENAGVSPGDRVIASFQISCGECEHCRAGRTAACPEAPNAGMFGVPADVGGGDWGGALADLVRVPFARSMLFALPDGIEPVAVASLSDNVADAWRAVGPQLAERPGAPVLVVGGGAHSISLYAVQIAVALRSERVDFIDTEPDRLALAERLGARAVEGPAPHKAGSFPITVAAGARHADLHCAIRSTEPDGVCTSVNIYFEPETPVPLLEMYTRGIRFHTGRVNSSAVVPRVLELVTDGRLDPSAVTSRVVSFDEAPEALADPPTKLVVAR
jgi:threonine dehydrogenase-like Zn-dependent dehydrogenase